VVNGIEEPHVDVREGVKKPRHVTISEDETGIFPHEPISVDDRTGVHYFAQRCSNIAQQEYGKVRLYGSSMVVKITRPGQ
jgi:hypothetical protein